MACIFEGSQFYLHTPRSSTNGMNHTCFAFPAEAGTHLPTPEGWKAELALGGWLHTEINVRHRELNQDTVTHFSTNRARGRLTSSIEANTLTTTPDRHQVTANVTVRQMSNDCANKNVFKRCLKVATDDAVMTSVRRVFHTRTVVVVVRKEVGICILYALHYIIVINVFKEKLQSLYKS